MAQAKKTGSYTATEQMVVSAAREIRDWDVIYVGVGLPTLATWLAKYTHAPHCTVVHEVGVSSEPLLAPWVSIRMPFRFISCRTPWRVSYM